ncbi:hypothetical protein [Streptomyces sp. NPDC002851]
MPEIHETVVLALGHDHGTDLVGCYTGTPVPPNTLVRRLRARLPEHMVPRRFHPTD